MSAEGKLYRVLTASGDAVYEARTGLLALVATRLPGGSWMLRTGESATVADSTIAAVFDALSLPPQEPIDALNAALAAGDDDEAIRLARLIRQDFAHSGLASLHAPVREAFLRLYPILVARGMAR